MAKKAMANAAAAGIGSVPAPRTAKPSVKKTKTAASDVISAPETVLELPTTAAPDAHQQIAALAYGYWIARGYQDGSQAEDWLRAEAEYLARA